MTPVLLTAAVATGALAMALLGPAIIRRASPALVRVPRLAVAMLSAAIVLWLGAVLAIGPMLAWLGPGPTLLPSRAADVCQRCLAAATPFQGGGVETAVPAVVLLALPTILALALGVGVAGQLLRRGSSSRDTARQVLHDARHRRVHGHDVAVLDADAPFAFTFPARQGGIVLSTGALAALDRDELAAVLVHEDAHLRQRHHLVSVVVASVAVYLRWVPLVAAVAAAVPHYLEIAADNQARRHAGTRALVSALVKFAEHAHAVPRRVHAQALHATGPDRIRQIVHPSGGLTGAVPVVVITGYLVTLAGVAVAVNLPYVSAALNGCI